ncbi:Integrase, catalytic core [Gossypium australe]|uniref:Integrase, catalytic core n=1 Tax=Gossypium australe TaxID=47621 RepID=A0A5B6VE37_9ROSI|nr:Integrase, catalytic core [Gossypium australe]
MKMLKELMKQAVEAWLDAYFLTASRLDIMFSVHALLQYEPLQSSQKGFVIRKRNFKPWNESSKKQEIVPQSTTEAEYVAATTEIKCDNHSTATIEKKNLIFYGRTKHFKIKYHFVKEVEQAKEVTLVHRSSQDQLTGILIKPFTKMKFENQRYDIRVCSMEVKKECCEVTIHTMANTCRKDANSPKVQAHPKLQAHQRCELC